jgi:hypothetical protein
MVQYSTNPRRTNCWNFVLVIEVLSLLYSIIYSFAIKDAGNGVSNIINLILFLIIFFHLQWIRLDINESGINVAQGFLNWPLFGWMFSTQLSKQEILRVERHERNIWPDWFPYFYCSPVNWCCGHKSYSGYVWPWCCLCCDATPSDRMIKIYLDDSRHRWAPCPCPCSLFWCCKYNIVSVTVDDPDSVMLEVSKLGYTTGSTMQSTTPNYNTNVPPV